MNMLKKIVLLSGLVLAFAFSASAQVTVTGSTGADGSYTTLKLAFDAINATAQTTAISIGVSANTNETASAVLNAGGWTSVTIRPTVAGVSISGTITGAIIKLNGADNVTIDGRVGGVGNAREMTVSNGSTATATAAIWLASVVAGNGAANNTIRNLEISCGADQQSSTNSTFGIIQTGTTISTTSTDGNDNDNNSFIANRIVRVRYGITSRGVTTNNNLNPIITDNIIGPAAFGIDQIGKVGIYMQADTGAVISRNTIQNVGVLTANTAGGADRVGIGIGGESWSVTDSTTITSGDYTVTRNTIQNIVEEKTFSSIGIKLGTTRSGVATNNLVANNFIINVRANGTSGDQFCGIGIAGGQGDRVVFNSLSITGDVDPGAAATSTTWGGGIRIPGANAANNANFTIQNNSIYLDVNSNTATQHYFAITLNSAAYAFGTGGLNRNNYYINAANPQLRTGGLGTATTAGPGTEFTTLANWQAALTVPQDAQSIQADPLYFSNTSDLHVPGSSPNVDSNGIGIAGVVDDIDGQVRPNPSTSINDIGADEFYTSPGTLQFSSAAYTNPETSSATITVTRGGGSNGAVQVDYATVAGGSATGGAACTAGVDYINTSGTLMWGDLDAAPKNFSVTLCADATFEASETVNLALSNVMVAALGTPNTAVLTITDAGTNFSGTVNVGTAQTATSLTNPGGIFQAINGGTVTGNVTINITSDLTGETGTVALNEFASPFTVTIKPSGAVRTVTGTSAAGMIPFNGADRVVIDGSLSGGTDRSLTFTNSGGGGGITFSTGTAGAQNNTVKNTNVFGGSATATIIGIAFQGNTFGSAGADNDNNRVENCDVRQSIYGIYSVGASAANKNTGLVVTKNVMTATGAARIGRVGIFTGFDDGAQITENQIDGINSAESADAVAIGAGSQTLGGTIATTPVDQINAFISRNRIGFVNQSNTFSSGGIVVGSGTTGTNTVVDNMISGVTGNATSGDAVVGIYVVPVAGATQNIYYNSVSMTGSRGATAGQHASIALAFTADQPINVINNILLNTQTQTGGGAGGRSYAIATAATTFANLISNHNNLFVSGAQGTVGMTGGLLNVAGTGTGVDRTTLGDWQTATGQDLIRNAPESVSVDPLFVSLTDLHLQATSTMLTAAAPIVGVNNDFDNDLRDDVPDIGADEIPNTGRTGAIPAGTYRDGLVGSSSLTGPTTFTGVFTFLTGTSIVNGGANVLTIGCTGSVVGADADSHVIGDVRKDFCGTGTFSFPVGTPGNGSARGNTYEKGDSTEGFLAEYSPATVTVNSGTFPSSLTIHATDTWMSGMGQTSSTSRYWTVVETGDLNVDMTMQYLNEDVYGNEPLYNVFKWDGAFATMQPGSVNAGANTFTATGVTSFSDWAAGVVSPTTAVADISGRVLTADGRPIANVRVTISGGNLPESISSYTGHLGIYNFADLPVGESYVVTIKSRRFNFANPTRLINLQQDITGEDFIADPQE